MKKFNFIIAIAIASLIFTGKANAFFNVIPVNVAEKAVVKIQVPANQETYVSVSDSKGENLHQETFTAGDVSNRYFDFTDLDNGVYTFYSRSGSTNTIKKIMVKDSNVEVISKEVEYKPVFLIKDEKLMVSYLNLSQEDIEFIIESNNTSYYQGDEGNSASFHKGFDISELQRGEYYAKLMVDGRAYHHYFTID